VRAIRYFLDTEFIEDGKTIDLVSLALVSDDGRELYCCNKDAKLELASDWVRANVIPSLPPEDSPLWMSRESIKWSVLGFVTEYPKPQFWAYYADYDWVALCQLFGTMMDLPAYFPMYCMDLKQLSVMRRSGTSSTRRRRTWRTCATEPIRSRLRTVISAVRTACTGRR